MSGRIKLRRSSQDNPLYFAEPFTRWQARQDLLLIANHSDGFFYVRWNPVEVKRWQVARSEKNLCERRQRSRDKVRKFLNDLEKMEQIIQQKNRICSVYIIVNYDKYQTTDHTTDHTTEKPQTRQQKNINKKKEKNKEWKEEKKKYAPKVFMTEKQYSNSCAKWTKPVVDEYIESISYYITNVKPKKKYKSIPKTITDWIKKDQQSGKRLAKLKSIYGDPLEIYSKFKKEVEDMENKEIHEYYKKNMMPKYHEDFLKEARALYSKKQNA